MLNHKTLALAVATLASFASFALAENTATNSSTLPEIKSSVAKSDKADAKTDTKEKPDAASKVLTFGTISKTNETYKAALDAHALDDALKQADKEGAFKGTVTGIYEPRDGSMTILNFDADYRSALTALLKKENYDRFPALTNLVSREIVVTGKFTNYQNRAEIVLTNSAQIKLVEETK